METPESSESPGVQLAGYTRFARSEKKSEKSGIAQLGVDPLSEDFATI